ncbi:MAG TPA: glycoside hydrolase family 88 protein [Niabella sp.]|nr:glycoside hydrolase family 88 protein [Niabella sp.]HQW13756.1 glycoside hydrolase family 88 protein [Niabella sp.]HQX19151.1 glycoside hydrolase family 88 protein [Niabella sp.]HQX42541.1 glycoside hydrolase family 88 protein [Niabella sp.]HRB34302.1 glycoside hydrolase family 88 protein [Niabella sp.]
MNLNFFRHLVLIACGCALHSANAQYVSGEGNDVSMPLHLTKPKYDIPYGETTKESVKSQLDKVFNYLNATTPAKIVNVKTLESLKDWSKVNSDYIFEKGDFRLTSYEWGVTYTGMLEVGAATGDKRYTDYTISRLNFLGEVVQHYKNFLSKNPGAITPVKSVIEPHALDDAGSLAASMIKGILAGADSKLIRPMVDHFINYILHKEFRLKDGTLARNRPLPNTLWLDDLYMSLPALAQMGKLTGDARYWDEVIRQYHHFSTRMFNITNNLYMHGWVQDMTPHTQFHWARANGWALMTKVEMLDVLPESDSRRIEILNKFKHHVSGLAKVQDKTGFWHQLLDKNDSYLETSATAIYAYCIARGINKGWLDAKAYLPMVLLAWNAVSSQITNQGQIQGTCVGTGMGFDPAFYYYRPVSNFAAHGYGPALLAGAEIYKMLQQNPFEINDSAVMLK